MSSASKPDFVEALRKADEQLTAYALPPSVQVRMRNRLLDRQKHSASGRRIKAVGVGLAFAAALTAFVFLARSSKESTEHAAVVSAGFAIESESDDLQLNIRPSGEVAIAGGMARLRQKEAGIAVANLSPVSLRSERQGIKFLKGKARFSVDKRLKAAGAVHVSVSHGRIEILGTDFTVVQGHDQGSVQLHEGVIRFVADDGTVEKLKPGDSLAWPLEKTAASKSISTHSGESGSPTIEASEPNTTPPKHSRNAAVNHDREADSRETQASRMASSEKVAQEDIIIRLAQLRSRGKFAQAAELLRTELQRRPWSVQKREQLSYELGSILTNHLRDTAKACSHWSQHLNRHGNGRYVAEARKTMQRLGCKGEDE